MSDPGLVIGHLTFKNNADPAVDKIIEELTCALDGDDRFQYYLKDLEWKAVSYTTSLHASARAFGDIVAKHHKHIKEFTLTIHALEEPYEELYFTGGRFVVNKVQR